MINMKVLSTAAALALALPLAVAPTVSFAQSAAQMGAMGGGGGARGGGGGGGGGASCRATGATGLAGGRRAGENSGLSMVALNCCKGWTSTGLLTTTSPPAASSAARANNAQRQSPATINICTAIDICRLSLGLSWLFSARTCPRAPDRHHRVQQSTCARSACVARLLVTRQRVVSRIAACMRQICESESQPDIVAMRVMRELLLRRRHPSPTHSRRVAGGNLPALPLCIDA